MMPLNLALHNNYCLKWCIVRAGIRSATETELCFENCSVVINLAESYFKTFYDKSFTILVLEFKQNRNTTVVQQTDFLKRIRNVFHNVKILIPRDSVVNSKLFFYSKISNEMDNLI